MSVRVVAILAAVVAVAAVAGYAALERVRPARRQAVSAPSASPGDTLSSAAEAVSTPTTISSVRGPSPATLRPRAPDAVEAKARRLAAREPYTRADLRRLIERTLAGKLGDRELGSADYEQLVDAILRLRAALRVLRGTDESPTTAAVREEQRQTVRSIFAEIEAITGLPPSELGSILTPDENASGDATPP